MCPSTFGSVGSFGVSSVWGWSFVVGVAPATGWARGGELFVFFGAWCLLALWGRLGVFELLWGYVCLLLWRLCLAIFGFWLLYGNVCGDNVVGVIYELVWDGVERVVARMVARRFRTVFDGVFCYLIVLVFAGFRGICSRFVEWVQRFAVCNFVQFVRRWDRFQRAWCYSRSFGLSVLARSRLERPRSRFRGIAVSGAVFF